MEASKTKKSATDKTEIDIVNLSLSDSFSYSSSPEGQMDRKIFNESTNNEQALREEFLSSYEESLETCKSAFDEDSPGMYKSAFDNESSSTYNSAFDEESEKMMSLEREAQFGLYLRSAPVPEEITWHKSKEVLQNLSLRIHKHKNNKPMPTLTTIREQRHKLISHILTFCMFNDIPQAGCWLAYHIADLYLSEIGTEAEHISDEDLTMLAKVCILIATKYQCHPGTLMSAAEIAYYPLEGYTSSVDDVLETELDICKLTGMEFSTPTVYAMLERYSDLAFECISPALEDDIRTSAICIAQKMYLNEPELAFMPDIIAARSIIYAQMEFESFWPYNDTVWNNRMEEFTMLTNERIFSYKRENTTPHWHQQQQPLQSRWNTHQSPQDVLR